jgi:hypothetical protein
MIREFLVGAALLAATPSLAQQAAAPPAADATCTDVTVGSAHGYECLNAQLAAAAHAGERPSSALDAPVSATSPSNVVGTFNESGTRNRLGANFGKSAQPAVPVQNFPPAFGARPRWER